jgi:hypothetical protein
MDTMLQHARMFGYRQALMPFTRVFLPERLALRFHRIHTNEQQLRDLIARSDGEFRIPLEVSEGLRATRANVLKAGSILVYTPGQHLYPARPLVARNTQKLHTEAKDAILAAGGQFSDERQRSEPVPISFELMSELLDLIQYDRSDEDSWDPEAIKGVLESNKRRFKGQGLLYCRKMRRTKFRQGALEGQVELPRLRAFDMPILCAFLEGEFVYPSFVMPDYEDMPAYLFSTSA